MPPRVTRERGARRPQARPRAPAQIHAGLVVIAKSAGRHLARPASMPATHRNRTPLPPRPASGSAAVDSTHRLLAALVERDIGGAAALFSPSACVWWSQRGGLANVDGAAAAARALVDLLERAPITKLTVHATSRNAVTSAYQDGDLAWTLELQVVEDAIVGAYVRGTTLVAA